MSKHEQVYSILKDNKIFSKSAIEKKAGMTPYKLHAFLHNRAPITDEEAASEPVSGPVIDAAVFVHHESEHVVIARVQTRRRDLVPFLDGQPRFLQPEHVRRCRDARPLVLDASRTGRRNAPTARQVLRELAHDVRVPDAGISR